MWIWICKLQTQKCILQTQIWKDVGIDMDVDMDIDAIDSKTRYDRLYRYDR